MTNSNGGTLMVSIAASPRVLTIMAAAVRYLHANLDDANEAFAHPSNPNEICLANEDGGGSIVPKLGALEVAMTVNELDERLCELAALLTERGEASTVDPPS